MQPLKRVLGPIERQADRRLGLQQVTHAQWRPLLLRRNQPMAVREFPNGAYWSIFCVECARTNAVAREVPAIPAPAEFPCKELP